MPYSFISRLIINYYYIHAKKGISHHYHNNTNDVKVMSAETNLNLFLKHHICADDFTSLPVTSDALVMNPNCTKCLSYRLFSAAY